MKKLSAILLLLSLATFARGQVSGTIADITRNHPSPEPSEILGKWFFNSIGMVFMDKSGAVPSVAEATELMNAMGATPQGCSVTFHDLRKCTFAVGRKTFNINWSVNADTCGFRVSMGPLGLSGYLVETDDGIEMIFSRPNLFTMLFFLCTGAERKYIKPLGELLDCTQGLTLGILFTR
ncbi:MAG: DUF4923 family protein [Bacteroidales bacterium]|nr:DUF4923 family protein [Bacteroidales bacterium]